MSDRIEINDDLLDGVTGGAITYTWDGEQGSLGINGYNPYQLLDKAAFLEVYNDLFGKVSDTAIIRELRARGIIVVPSNNN